MRTAPLRQRKHEDSISMCPLQEVAQGLAPSRPLATEAKQTPSQRQNQPGLRPSKEGDRQKPHQSFEKHLRCAQLVQGCGAACFREGREFWGRLDPVWQDSPETSVSRLITHLIDPLHPHESVRYASRISAAPDPGRQHGVVCVAAVPYTFAFFNARKHKIITTAAHCWINY